MSGFQRPGRRVSDGNADEPGERETDNLANAEEDALALINATLRRIAELSRMLHDSQSSDDSANIEHELARLNGKRSELQLKHRSLAQLNARL